MHSIKACLASAEIYLRLCQLDREAADRLEELADRYLQKAAELSMSPDEDTDEGEDTDLLPFETGTAGLIQLARPQEPGGVQPKGRHDQTDQHDDPRG